MSVIDFFPQSLECDKKSLAKILKRIPVPPQGKEKAIEMAPEPATFSPCSLSLIHLLLHFISFCPLFLTQCPDSSLSAIQLGCFLFSQTIALFSLLGSHFSWIVTWLPSSPAPSTSLSTYFSTEPSLSTMFKTKLYLPILFPYFCLDFLCD
jgi:hypothetical protein